MGSHKLISSRKLLDVISTKSLRFNLFLLVLTFFTTLISIPVYAISASNLGIDNFSRVFESIGRFLANTLNNTYAVFGVTVFIFTMMFYNIFVPLIAKIPVFKGGDKSGIANKYGKVVSLCFAILSSMGIFGLIFINGGAANVQEILERTLGPFELFAGVMLAFIVFGAVYFGFKDADSGVKWRRSLWGAGFALVFAGFIMNKESLLGIGFLIVAIVLLYYLFHSGVDTSAGSSGSGSGGSGGSGGGTGGGGGGTTPTTTIVLTGEAQDNAGNPITNLSIVARDDTGNNIPGASATTNLHDGKFTMRWDLSSNIILDDIVGTSGTTIYSAGKGASTAGGTNISRTNLTKGRPVNIAGIILRPTRRGAPPTPRWVLTNGGVTGGPNFRIHPRSHFLVDPAGNPIVFNSGDVLNFRFQAIVSSFDPTSTGSYLKLLDAVGNVAYQLPFLPNLNSFVTGTGGALSAGNTVVTFRITLPPGLTPQNYKARLKLETV
jgi:hypothetical protein